MALTRGGAEDPGKITRRPWTAATNPGNRRKRLVLGQRAGVSPDANPTRALSVRTGVAWGVGSAGNPNFRAVLVAIDRLSLLVTHFGVAVERAAAAPLPPPIEPEGH